MPPVPDELHLRKNAANGNANGHVTSNGTAKHHVMSNGSANGHVMSNGTSNGDATSNGHVITANGSANSHATSNGVTKRHVNGTAHTNTKSGVIYGQTLDENGAVMHNYPDMDDELHKPHLNLKKTFLTANLPPHLQKLDLVGIDGKWYDVTGFKHPGGPVIEHFLGQDATAIFHAQGHKEWVLKYRKPVATYTMPVRHPADADFENLVKEFQEKGYFTTDFTYYIKKSIFISILLSMVFYCVMGFESMWMHLLGAVFLTFVWQQSALVMHDFMHSQVFRKHSIDRLFGVFFGTTLFGISAHWWRDEHILHHGLCNTVDAAKKWADPQMWEMSWAQSTKLFPLFREKLDYYMIKIQQFTFVPCVVLIGRYEIVLDSFRKERRPIEWVGLFFHICWLGYLLSHLPTWSEVALFYFIAATYEGWLHFQLILSHYCKLFCTIDEYHSTSWYVVQILSNLNIKNPWYWDWYYGGLNYHIEHHLFPTMARNKLRTASDRVRDVCRKHNIDYDFCTIVEALTKTLVHLKNVGATYEHFEYL